MKKIVLNICSLVLLVICLIICILNLIFFNNMILYIVTDVITTIAFVINVFYIKKK